MTSYSDVGLYPHWFKWHVAWRHQTITRTHVDSSYRLLTRVPRHSPLESDPYDAFENHTCKIKSKHFWVDPRISITTINLYNEVSNVKSSMGKIQFLCITSIMAWYLIAWGTEANKNTRKWSVRVFTQEYTSCRKTGVFNCNNFLVK